MNGIGKKIKRYRKLNKWTQEQLGEKLGESSQVISNWEREYSSPNKENIHNLASVLNISSDYLLGLTDDPTPITETNEEDKIIDLKMRLNQYREAVRAGKKVPYDGGYLTENQINKIEKFIESFVIEKNDA